MFTFLGTRFAGYVALIEKIFKNINLKIVRQEMDMDIVFKLVFQE
jgi:hypothetical protein